MIRDTSQLCAVVNAGLRKVLKKWMWPSHDYFSMVGMVIKMLLKYSALHSGLVSRIIRDLDSVLLYVVKVTGSSGWIGQCAINPIWKMDDLCTSFCLILPWTVLLL